MDERLDTKDIILKAAMDRILHYGYGKTTMAEIASDCSMSAGNIYRFFASKLDIAEAMARKINADVYQTFSEIARDSSKSAEERLNTLFVFRMERTYELLEKDAKVLEVAEVLSEERPEFANEELAQERIYIGSILKQGVERSEFHLTRETDFTAEMIQTALMKFGYPQLWSQLSLDGLHRELEGVLDLIFRALRT